MKLFKIITIIMLCPFIYTHVFGQSPSVVWISTQYDSTTAGWGETHFDLIQDGINAVAHSGTTYVAEGIYYEQIIIEKTIYLFGENSETTVIDAQNSGSSLFIKGVDGGAISGLTVTASGSNYPSAGLTIDSSSNVIVEQIRSLENKGHGIVLIRSENITISNSEIRRNIYMGIQLQFSNQCTIYNNYIYNTWPIMISTSKNNTIEDNEIHSISPSGISLYECSTNNKIQNNYIKGVEGDEPCTSIRSIWASYNLYENNTIERGRYGIVLCYSDHSIIAANTITELIDGDAIILYHGNGNSVINNSINNELYGGILLFGASSDNLIQANTISVSQKGISVHHNSNDNNIVNNSISNALYGIVLNGSSRNTTYENNLISNTNQAYDNIGNNWSAESIGNYWSDYTGCDVNGDGLGDTSYPIPSAGMDHYPLMTECTISEVSVPELEIAPAIEYIGWWTYIRDTISWENETKEVYKIIIESGGSLTLNNVTLSFRGYMFEGIQVDSGATFEVHNSTILGTGKNVKIKKGASFILTDSEVYSVGNWGSISIEADNAVIENNIIEDTWGIGITNSSNHTITGNKIINAFDGPNGFSLDNLQILNNEFRNIIHSPITICGWSNSTVTGNTIENVWGKIYVKTGRWPHGLVHMYENNFIDYHFSLESAPGLIWDSDNRGNYYEGFLDRYPAAGEHEEFSGIWNTPYVFPNGDKDNFPLMNQIHQDTVISEPAIPILTAPLNGANDVSIETSIHWNPSGNATSYRLQISNEPNFSSPIVNRGSITECKFILSNLESSKKYYWRIMASNLGVISEWSEIWNFTTEECTQVIDKLKIPIKFLLAQNYPNPFNSSTTIKYQLPKQTSVSLRIYNLSGQLVRTLIDKKQIPGKYTYIWYGKDDTGKRIASGIYIYKIHTEYDVQTKKMVLIQ